MSDFERIIYRILLRENKKFKQEKVITDLRNGLYRFDFYLPTEKIAIEVQGPQHYEYNKFFHKKRSEFTKAQERDRQKISYCLAHGIKLYCIPYWEVEGIYRYKDIIQDKFLAKSKFHNDFVWKNRNVEKS